jgi:hypothetical protein
MATVEEIIYNRYSKHLAIYLTNKLESYTRNSQDQDVLKIQEILGYT